MCDVRFHWFSYVEFWILQLKAGKNLHGIFRLRLLLLRPEELARAGRTEGRGWKDAECVRHAYHRAGRPGGGRREVGGGLELVGLVCRAVEDEKILLTRRAEGVEDRRIRHKLPHSVSRVRRRRGGERLKRVRQRDPRHKLPRARRIGSVKLLHPIAVPRLSVEGQC